MNVSEQSMMHTALKYCACGLKQSGMHAGDYCILFGPTDKGLKISCHDINPTVKY